MTVFINYIEIVLQWMLRLCQIASDWGKHYHWLLNQQNMTLVSTGATCTCMCERLSWPVDNEDNNISDVDWNYPTNTVHLANVGLMLAHRLRLWSNIKPTSAVFFVFTSFPNVSVIAEILGNVRTQKKGGADPMLFSCWPSVKDAGPAWKQHWLNVFCMWGDSCLTSGDQSGFKLTARQWPPSKRSFPATSLSCPLSKYTVHLIRGRITHSGQGPSPVLQKIVIIRIFLNVFF